MVQQQKAWSSRIKTTIKTPARLHLGFLDLNGASGRKFGSIGLAINSHFTEIDAQLAQKNELISLDTISPSIEHKIHQIIHLFYDTIGQHIPDIERSLRLTLKTLIPEHAGLGSGTQLALAIGTALCQLHKINLSTADIAAQLGRGKRSGIGISSFDHGGFIIDGGVSNQTNSVLPTLIAHYPFPNRWRAVIIMDDERQGIHGVREVTAFETLPDFPANDSHTICHLVLMKLLPALIEQKIEPFGEAITDIQVLIGNHFAPIQGGQYTSLRVAKLLHYAQSIGHLGVAQSSWGPTGCIFVDSQLSAEQLMAQLIQHSEQLFDTTLSLSFHIAQASEDGATIETSTL